MGIYLFKREVILKLLDNALADFGKHVIPDAISSRRVLGYVFQGYWEDIGTIRSFFEANLDLTADLPRFNFFDMSAPIFTRPRFLPASKINGAEISHASISDGCIIDRCKVRQSIVGIRSRIEEGCERQPHHPAGLRFLRIGDLHPAVRGARAAAGRRGEKHPHRERDRG